jgi:ferredoxin--NADP+ reductase
MYKILKKTPFSAAVTEIVIDAPQVARKTEPGQFVIIRVEENGERIPLTVSDYDREKGTITLVFQAVGATTLKLQKLGEGDYLPDCVGPLGRPTDTDGYKKVAVVGGGVGCAIALPVAKKLAKNGASVDCITGFRNKDLVIMEDGFRQVGGTFRLMTDDGSRGEKGLVTDALKSLIEGGAKYDCVYVFGPLVMMKFVAKLTASYGVKTYVSMNPIMIDGTGMCGGCRLTVGGETKFACVDGPEFDGALVDFDEAISRSKTYKQQERKAYSDACNLFREVK